MLDTSNSSSPQRERQGLLTQDIYSWALNASSYPHLTRKTLELRLINKEPLKIAHDDEVCLPHFLEINGLLKIR